MRNLHLDTLLTWVAEVIGCKAKMQTAATEMPKPLLPVELQKEAIVLEPLNRRFLAGEISEPVLKNPQGAMAVLAAITALLAALLAAIFLPRLAPLVLLEVSSEFTTGTLQDLRVGSDGPAHHVDYTFTTAAGEVVVIRNQPYFGIPSEVEVERFAVRYFPRYPRVSAPASGFDTARVSAFGGFFLASMVLVAGGMMLFSAHGSRHHLRVLRRHGRIAIGRIETVRLLPREQDADHASARLHEVGFTFTLVSGKCVHGTTCSDSPQFAQEPTTLLGKPLAVLVFSEENWQVL